MIKTREYTGYSNEGIREAISNALEKAEEHSHFEVIETRSSKFKDEQSQYQVTLTTFPL